MSKLAQNILIFVVFILLELWKSGNDTIWVLFEKMLSKKSKIFKSSLNNPRLTLCKLWSLNREWWVGIWAHTLKKTFETRVRKTCLDKFWSHPFILVFKLFNFNTEVRLWSLHRFSSLFWYLPNAVNKFVIFFLLLDGAASEWVAKLILSYFLFFLFFFDVIWQKLGGVYLRINLLA